MKTHCPSLFSIGVWQTPLARSNFAVQRWGSQTRNSSKNTGRNHKGIVVSSKCLFFMAHTPCWFFLHNPGQLVQAGTHRGLYLSTSIINQENGLQLSVVHIVISSSPWEQGMSLSQPGIQWVPREPGLYRETFLKKPTNNQKKKNSNQANKRQQQQQKQTKTKTTTQLNPCQPDISLLGLSFLVYPQYLMLLSQYET